MSSNEHSNDPLDFMKNMWGNRGFSLPGMVTPTFDVDEISKRIDDLKAVEGWLRMNLSMLQMTIQNLEMQRSTLSAVRAMGQMATEEPARAPTGEGEAASEESNPFAQAAMWPWNMMQQLQAQMQAEAQAGPKQERGSAAPESAEKSAKTSEKKSRKPS